MIQSLLTLGLCFLTLSARAESLGDISYISQEGIVRFYVGEEHIQTGEELQVLNSRNQMVALLKVLKVSPPHAEAQVTAFKANEFGMFEKIQSGFRVRVAIEKKSTGAISFILGPSLAPKSGDYGGTSYFVGLSIHGFLTEQIFWSLRLQADSLGKNSAGIEKRRSAYMLGAGYSIKNFNFAGHLGLVDTMTINENEVKESYDPFTGTSVVKGVQHDDAWGYQANISYNIFLKEITRTHFWGWSLSPQISYTDVFKSTPYKGYVSIGLSIDLWSNYF